MSESAKEAWSDVGERFTVWGRGVAERYREAGDAAESEAVETETEMKRAAKELVDELSRGINALGETFRDDQAKRDLADAVSAIGDAITKTVNEASEGLRAGKSSSADDGPKDGA
jgi:DNA-binding ferritin-like protein